MSYQWIEKLNESNSRLKKEEVLIQVKALSVLGNENAIRFLRFFNLCYNPFITLGIKKVPKGSDISTNEEPWDDFVDLLKDFNKRNTAS